MLAETCRFTLSITSDLAKRADELKKKDFYDTSYSEMYRQLIKLGMDEYERRSEKTTPPASA